MHIHTNYTHLDDFNCHNYYHTHIQHVIPHTNISRIVVIASGHVDSCKLTSFHTSKCTSFPGRLFAKLQIKKQYQLKIDHHTLSTIYSKSAVAVQILAHLAS